MPDGHCIDSDGNIWVAMYGAGGILKIDTTRGQCGFLIYCLILIEFSAPASTPAIVNCSW